MKTFLFRLSRLLPFISIGLIVFSFYEIIEQHMSKSISRSYNIFGIDTNLFGVLFFVFLFCLSIVFLFNWMIYGKNTFWIKEEFTNTKINKNIILFRLSRVISSIVFILLFYSFCYFFDRNRFYFEDNLGLLSIFILLIYNWLCFGKFTFWIKSPNKEE